MKSSEPEFVGSVGFSLSAAGVEKLGAGAGSGAGSGAAVIGVAAGVGAT